MSVYKFFGMSVISVSLFYFAFAYLGEASDENLLSQNEVEKAFVSMVQKSPTDGVIKWENKDVILWTHFPSKENNLTIEAIETDVRSVIDQSSVWNKEGGGLFDFHTHDQFSLDEKLLDEVNFYLFATSDPRQIRMFHQSSYSKF